MKEIYDIPGGSAFESEESFLKNAKAQEVLEVNANKEAFSKKIIYTFEAITDALLRKLQEAK